MKSPIQLVSAAVLLLVATQQPQTTQAVHLDSSHKIHSHTTVVYDPEPFKKMFAQVDTEI